MLAPARDRILRETARDAATPFAVRPRKELEIASEGRISAESRTADPSRSAMPRCDVFQPLTMSLIRAVVSRAVRGLGFREGQEGAGVARVVPGRAFTSPFRLGGVPE